MKQIGRDMKVIRQYAAAMIQDGNYQIVVNGIVRAFHLTETRANEWARYYKNAIVEKMS